MEIEQILPIKGEQVRMNDGREYIRYSSDNWVECIGESTETVFYPDAQEEAYQRHMDRVRPYIEAGAFGHKC